MPCSPGRWWLRASGWAQFYEGIDVVVRRLSRSEVTDVSADQPTVWTLLEFAADSKSAEDLARRLAGVCTGPAGTQASRPSRTVVCLSSFPARSSDLSVVTSPLMLMRRLTRSLLGFLNISVTGEENVGRLPSPILLFGIE